MVTKETTMQGRVGRLLRLLARLNSNREELPQLELSRVQFEALLGRLQEATGRQSFHTAAKQEASQEVQGFLVEAERLATVLHVTVKQHYGIRSEKLAEFGLKPFRGRRKPSQTTEPPPPDPDPEPSTAESTVS